MVAPYGLVQRCLSEIVLCIYFYILLLQKELYNWNVARARSRISYVSGKGSTYSREEERQRQKHRKKRMQRKR